MPPIEKRVVPSGISPLPWVTRIAPHRLVLPERQNSHLPHSGMYSGITCPRLDRGHAGAKFLYDGAAFVTDDPGNSPSGSFPTACKRQCGTRPSHDPDQHLAFFWRGNFDLFDASGLPASHATAALDFMASLQMKGASLSPRDTNFKPSNWTGSIFSISQRHGLQRDIDGVRCCSGRTAGIALLAGARQPLPGHEWCMPERRGLSSNATCRPGTGKAPGIAESPGASNQAARSVQAAPAPPMSSTVSGARR